MPKGFRFGGRPICKTPANAHPFIKILNTLVPKQDWGRVAITSGVYSGTIRSWRRCERAPNMYSFDFVLRALGCKLAIVPIDWEPNHVNEKQTIDGTTVHINGVEGRI